MLRIKIFSISMDITNVQFEALPGFIKEAWDKLHVTVRCSLRLNPMWVSIGIHCFHKAVLFQTAHQYDNATANNTQYPVLLCGLRNEIFDHGYVYEVDRDTDTFFDRSYEYFDDLPDYVHIAWNRLSIDQQMKLACGVNNVVSLSENNIWFSTHSGGNGLPTVVFKVCGRLSSSNVKEIHMLYINPMVVPYNFIFDICKDFDRGVPYTTVRSTQL